MTNLTVSEQELTLLRLGLASIMVDEGRKADNSRNKPATRADAQGRRERAWSLYQKLYAEGGN